MLSLGKNRKAVSFCIIWQVAAPALPAVLRSALLPPYHNLCLPLLSNLPLSVTANKDTWGEQKRAALCTEQGGLGAHHGGFGWLTPLLQYILHYPNSNSLILVCQWYCVTKCFQVIYTLFNTVLSLLLSFIQYLVTVDIVYDSFFGFT